MYHIFCIHSSVNGHLGFFHVLAIVNITAMMWGAEKIQEAEEGSLPEWCISEDKVLIRKGGLSEWCNSEGKFLKKVDACVHDTILRTGPRRQ